MNVLVQPTSDVVELGKGEHLILFLSKENTYDGYTIIGAYQGKIGIDPNGVVYGLEMERNITDCPNRSMIL